MKSMCLKKLILFIPIILLLCFSIGSIFATQTHSYAISYRSQSTSITGFCAGSTLPLLTSGWVSGLENKINYETWFNINNSTSQWVEIGYHAGYAWYTNGSPNVYSFYDGLFIARAGPNNSWYCQAFNSQSWDAGESHTWKILLRQTSSIWYADMYSDGSIFASLGYCAPSNTGSTDAGVEVGSDGMSQFQDVSSTSMWGLQSMVNGSWKRWDVLGSVGTYNNTIITTATYNSSTNRINFN